MLKDQKELTGEQLNGLTALVALAVFSMVIKIFIPFLGASATLPEPFFKKEPGILTIALDIDGRERGVYSLPPGATVKNLMNATGTTLLSEFDVGIGSHKLLTGDKVYLSSVSSATVVGRMTAAQSLALDLPMDINKASVEDLVLVPGIGEKTAERIINLRVTKGRFHSLDELMELSGIRDKKFGKLKKYFFAVP